MTRIQRGWAVAAVLAGALFACTIALFLGGTMPLAPAKPWKNRRVIKVRILGDRIEITVMAMKSTRQTRSGFLRPR